MQALFSISHGMAVIPRRNDKQRLCNCFFWEGGGGGDKERMHYVKCGSGEYDFTSEF